MVRFTINGVEMTGRVVGQERDINGRWIYEILPLGCVQTEKMHDSDLEVI